LYLAYFSAIVSNFAVKNEERSLLVLQIFHVINIFRELEITQIQISDNGTIIGLHNFRYIPLGSTSAVNFFQQSAWYAFNGYRRPERLIDPTNSANGIFTYKAINDRGQALGQIPDRFIKLPSSDRTYPAGVTGSADLLQLSNLGFTPGIQTTPSATPPLIWMDAPGGPKAVSLTTQVYRADTTTYPSATLSVVALKSLNDKNQCGMDMTIGGTSSTSGSTTIIIQENETAPDTITIQIPSGNDARKFVRLKVE
jgi:hypothetical protein